MSVSNFFPDSSYYPEHYDNPYCNETTKTSEQMTENFLKAFRNEDDSDDEMTGQALDILVKPRNWTNSAQGNTIKAMMEPFLSEHLSQIQKVALESSTTVHFGKTPPYRSPGLEKLTHLVSPLSFRVTCTGDVWILFKNKANEEHHVRHCYSPTLEIYGVKKGIDRETKEKYDFLSNLNRQIENSNKESPIIQILDIALVPFRKFKDPELEEDPTNGESDKYSIITPKFNFSLTQISEQDFTDPLGAKKFLQCLKISIYLWINLIEEHNIIHPDFNSGNIVFSLDSNNRINKVKLIDFDEFIAPLSPLVSTVDGNLYDTKNIILKYLAPSISEALKTGLDTIFSHTKDCINKSLTLASKKKFSSQAGALEAFELTKIARELISGLNILAFGPLYLSFENDPKWLFAKDAYLNKCIEKISVLENTMCIKNILEQAHSFIKKIEKIID